MLVRRSHLLQPGLASACTRGTLWSSSYASLPYGRSVGGCHIVNASFQFESGLQKRWKGTAETAGSSGVKRTTKKLKTKKGSIMRQKDKKLASIRDSKTAEAPSSSVRRKKAPSLLEAAGIKQKNELSARKSKATEEPRESRLVKSLNKKKAIAAKKHSPGVEVVGEDQQTSFESENLEPSSIPPIERDWIEPGEEGYETLPPPLDLDGVINRLKEEKAQNIVVLDVRKKCNFTSYMVIVEGRSGRHVRGITDALTKELKHRQRSLKLQTDIVSIVEGNTSNNDWLVIDTGEVLVEIFSEGARRYYDLDELWISKGTAQEEMRKTDSIDELDPLPDLNDVPGGWNPFDMGPEKGSGRR